MVKDRDKEKRKGKEPEGNKNERGTESTRVYEIII